MIYLLQNSCCDPHFNLALEEYLLKQQTDEFIMFWVNNPAVIVGRNQLTAEEVNLDFAARHDIPVVRRLSGGGAVYHDPNVLNYTFIFQKGSDNSMQRLTEPIVAALRSLGLLVQFSGRNDLTIAGRKFSGTAQCHFRDRILHHGTLLLSVDADRMQSVLAVSNDKLAGHGVQSVRSRVTGLNEHLSRPLTAQALSSLLTEHLLQMFPAAKLHQLTAADREAVERLVREKYATREWNYGVAPAATLIRKARFSSGTVECRLQIADGRIQAASFSGDFFGARDIGELAQLLVGVTFTQTALAGALQRIDLSAYIAGLEQSELLALLAEPYIIESEGGICLES